MKEITLSILLLVSLTKPSDCRGQADETVTRVFSLIYNTRFDEAEKILDGTDFQDEPFYLQMLKLDLFWWKYSIRQTKACEDKLNSVLTWFSEQNQNAKYTQINRLIWLSYKMRFEVKRKNYLSALLLKSKVEEQLRLVQKKPVVLPAGEQNLFSVFVLLLQYSNETVSIFANDADKQACLKALEKWSTDSDLIVSSEAHYFLGRIYTKIEKQPEKGKEHFQLLAQRFPQNRLFTDLAKGLAVDF